jgi:hypothetical protein
MRTLLPLLFGSALLLGCDGDSTETAPPPVNTRVELRVDGKAVALEAPSGHADGTPATFVEVSARRPSAGSDYIQMTQIKFDAPAKGHFDCSPEPEGVHTHTATVFVDAALFGFLPTIKTCSIDVSYLTNDRIVGTFTLTAAGPEGSSVGTSTAEGAFDVPLEQ